MVPRMQLLLVEDDPTMQTTLQRALTRRGMEVAAVGDGRAALSQWVGALPDAVVLDLTLPGLDGLQVLQQCSRTRPAHAGADPDRARHRGRPGDGAERRGRRLPAQTL